MAVTVTLSMGFLAMNILGLYFLKIGALQHNQGIPMLGTAGFNYAAGAILQIFAFIIFGYLLKLIPLFMVQILQSAIFALTILLSWAFFKEDISIQSWIGIVIIFAGIMIITAQ